MIPADLTRESEDERQGVLRDFDQAIIGTFVTGILRAVQAATSMLSRPIPNRATILQFVAAAITSAGTLAQLVMIASTGTATRASVAAVVSGGKMTSAPILARILVRCRDRAGVIGDKDFVVGHDHSKGRVKN